MATGEKKAGGTAAAGEGRRGGCRQGGCRRQTRETDITLTLALDGSGQVGVETGIGFFDHMLTAFAVHGGLDLTLRAKGDLAVDGHHTVEDCGIAIGVALREALGDKSGISRFGSALLPMDDALA
ncbi:MAG: hypothetical protein LBK98_00955, partial [Peptococcaceae bacterium]|nr:hypothetical protein [Peptococcaceae bacterium]